jgi:hypothetical protein
MIHFIYLKDPCILDILLLPHNGRDKEKQGHFICLAPKEFPPTNRLGAEQTWQRAGAFLALAPLASLRKVLDRSLTGFPPFLRK